MTPLALAIPLIVAILVLAVRGIAEMRRRSRQLRIDAEAKDLLSELQRLKVNETVSDEFKARIRSHLDKAAY
jgi:hypothetical protein